MLQLEDELDLPKDRGSRSPLRKQLFNQVYSHERLIDIFSLYFFYYELLREVNRCFDSESSSQQSLQLSLGVLKEKLLKSASIKIYERHILQKIFIILMGIWLLDGGRGKEEGSEYRIYDDGVFCSGVLDKDKDRKVHVYSFITVLEMGYCRSCASTALKPGS